MKLPLAAHAPEQSPRRRIAHIDMDAFFASVELLSYPQLSGQAVVVGGRSIHQPTLQSDGSYRFAHLADYAGRGVITTSTYAARALGVFSGMGLMKSARLAPQAILLPANFEAYRHYSRAFKAAIIKLAPIMEDRGIDEIYVDLSEHAEASYPLAQRLKQAVHEATGLCCSIGIAPNKLLAKICSDLDKPDGITVLLPDELASRIWPLPAKKINGIGPKSAAHLAELEIHSIGELAQAPVDFLVRHFGKRTGIWLHNAAHGRDERPIITQSEPKSISRESTFERDLHAQQNKAELSDIFTALCQRVADDLQRQAYLSHTIGIKIRFADFQVVTRDITATQSTNDTQAILALARQCLKRVALTQKIRLLGIRASRLIPVENQPLEVTSYQTELPF